MIFHKAFEVRSVL